MDDRDIGIKMTRIIITIAIIFFLAMPGAYADYSLSLLMVDEKSVSSVNSILGFTVENRGFEKVFFALPIGWSFNESVDPDSWSSMKGYPVIDSGLWRIYGMPSDRSSYLGAFETTGFLTGKVWTGEGANHRNTSLQTRTGWWMYPNEKLVVQIELTIPSGGGTIDPSLLGADYKWVRVTKWEQEFILPLTANDSGFFTAPWTVKNGKLSSTIPAAYCDEGQADCPGTVYWDDFTIGEEMDVPAWDSWFELDNSLVESLKTTPTPTKTEFIEVEGSEDQINVVTPVWKIAQSPTRVPEIRYTYEWRRDQILTGGVTFGTTASTTPAWYQWF